MAFSCYAMQRAVLAIVLVGASASAGAELWVKVGENEKFTAYADPATMRRDGNMVKIWTMFDYRTAAQPGDAGRKFLSIKRYTEYDCKQARMQVFEAVTFSGNLTKGEMVGTTRQKLKASPVASGTADDLLLDLACGIKDQDKGGENLKKILPALPGK